MFLSEAKKILKKNGYRIDERINKDYFRLIGFECVVSEDNYKEGQLDEVRNWNKIEKKTFNTFNELIDYIKETYANEFYSKKDIKNEHLSLSNYDDGSFNIDFSVLVNMDKNDYLSEPTASEKASWKKGKKKLYNLDIIGHIESNFEADELYEECKKIGIWNFM